MLSFRIPSKVLKPEDWVRGNGQSWRPQLGFNPNRQQAHLDQSGFRALGYVHIYIFNIINVTTMNFEWKWFRVFPLSHSPQSGKSGLLLGRLFTFPNRPRLVQKSVGVRRTAVQCCISYSYMMRISVRIMEALYTPGIHLPRPQTHCQTGHAGGCCGWYNVHNGISQLFHVLRVFIVNLLSITKRMGQ